MAEDHTSSLLDTITKIIRQELGWSERQFKRITMSHDASNNPAELYGADGKIYYRSAGGAGAEIGISGGGLWASGGSPSVTSLTTPEDLDMQSTTVTGYGLLNCHDIDLYDGHVYSPRLNFRTTLAAGFSGYYVKYSGANARLELLDRETHAVISAIGTTGGFIFSTKAVMSNNNVEGVNTLKAHGTNSLMFWDNATGTKTLAQLATGGGTLDHAALTSNMTFATCGHSGFMANPAAANLAMADFTLTAVGGITMNDATSPIAMAGSEITGVVNIKADVYSGVGFYDHNTSSGYRTLRAVLAPTDYALVCYSGNINMNTNDLEDVGGITMNNATSPIDMNGSEITNVAAIKGKLGTDLNFWGSDSATPNAAKEYMRFEYSGETIRALVHFDLCGNILDRIVLARGKIGSDVEFWGSNSGNSSIVQYARLDRTNERIYMLRELWMGYLGGTPNSICNARSIDFWGQTSAPASPSEGELYFDSNTGVKKLKVYNGTGWETVTSA